MTLSLFRIQHVVQLCNSYSKIDFLIFVLRNAAALLLFNRLIRCWHAYPKGLCFFPIVQKFDNISTLNCHTPRDVCFKNMVVVAILAMLLAYSFECGELYPLTSGPFENLKKSWTHDIRPLCFRQLEKLQLSGKSLRHQKKKKHLYHHIHRKCGLHVSFNVKVDIMMCLPVQNTKESLKIDTQQNDEYSVFNSIENEVLLRVPII